MDSAPLAWVRHFMKLVMSTLGIEHRWTFRHRGGQLVGWSTPAAETCYTVTRRGHVTLCEGTCYRYWDYQLLKNCLIYWKGQFSFWKETYTGAVIFCRKSKISRHDVSLVSPNIAKSRLKVALFHNDLCTTWKKKYLKHPKIVCVPCLQCWPWGICQWWGRSPPAPCTDRPGCPPWWPPCCSSWRSCNVSPRQLEPPAQTLPAIDKTDCNPGPRRTDEVSWSISGMFADLPCHHRCYICTV